MAASLAKDSKPGDNPSANLQPNKSSTTVGEDDKVDDASTDLKVFVDVDEKIGSSSAADKLKASTELPVFVDESLGSTSSAAAENCVGADKEQACTELPILVDVHVREGSITSAAAKNKGELVNSKAEEASTEILVLSSIVDIETGLTEQITESPHPTCLSNEEVDDPETRNHDNKHLHEATTSVENGSKKEVECGSPMPEDDDDSDDELIDVCNAQEFPGQKEEFDLEFDSELLPQVKIVGKTSQFRKSKSVRQISLDDSNIFLTNPDGIDSNKSSYTLPRSRRKPHKSSSLETHKIENKQIKNVLLKGKSVIYRKIVEKSGNEEQPTENISNSESGDVISMQPLLQPKPHMRKISIPYKILRDGTRINYFPDISEFRLLLLWSFWFINIPM